MTEEKTAASDINQIEWRLGELHKNALLNKQRDRIGEIDAQLVRLPQQVAQLRTRGYVYKPHLEEQLAQLAQRWLPVRAQATAALELQVATLRPQVDRADEAVRRLQPLKTRRLTAVETTLKRVKDELSAIERRVNAAQKAVEGIFGALASEVQAVESDVKECERMLQWLDGASFSLHAGEGLVAATEARCQEGEERTSGILFLTDRRMLFERREKIARKKFLFITTASELAKELYWEVALSDLERVEAGEARKALVLKRELLAVVPRSGAHASPVDLELDTDSDGWRALVLRCQSGNIAHERAGGAPEVAEYAVPAKCPYCGASPDQVGHVRGISSIRCDYCGEAIPLERV